VGREITTRTCSRSQPLQSFCSSFAGSVLSVGKSNVQLISVSWSMARCVGGLALLMKCDNVRKDYISHINVALSTTAAVINWKTALIID